LPYQRLARHVLDEWREVERQLLLLDPRLPEAEELVGEAHRLREEYQHLVDEAIAHDRPVPPPFPVEDLPDDERGDGPDIALTPKP
jgi:hypothetical protein